MKCFLLLILAGVSDQGFRPHQISLDEGGFGQSLTKINQHNTELWRPPSALNLETMNVNKNYVLKVCKSLLISTTY